MGDPNTPCHIQTLRITRLRGPLLPRNSWHFTHCAGKGLFRCFISLRTASFYSIYEVQPFLYEMAPYQTLRAETWWTLLQITFRVFFTSRNPGNHNNMSPPKKDVLFLEKKKAPARVFYAPDLRIGFLRTRPQSGNKFPLYALRNPLPHIITYPLYAPRSKSQLIMN